MVVTLGEGALLASSEQRPRMLLNSVQCTGQPEFLARTSMVPKRKLRPSRSPPIVLTGPRLRHPGAPGAMKMNNPQSQSSRQTEADSLQNSALHKQP